MSDRTRKYVRYITPLLVAFLLGLSLLVLVGKSQDFLIGYFPPNPAVYATVSARPDIIGNKFYVRLSESFKYKQLVDELMGELFPGTKNISFAAYGTAKQPRFVIAFHLKENADTAPFEAMLRDYQWGSFVVTRRVSGSKILLISNDTSYMETLRDTYGLDNNGFIAIQNISLNEILSNNEGNLQLHPKELGELMPAISEVTGQLENERMDNIRLALSISKKQGNLIASNLQLEPLNTLQLKKPGMINRAFSLGHVDGVLTQILNGIRSRYQTKNSVLSLLSVYEANRPETLSYFDYDSNEMLMNASWKTAVAPAVRDQLVQTLQDLLAYGHSLSKTIYLPDGSPIVAVMKHSDASQTTVSNNITLVKDLVSREDYRITTSGNKLELLNGDQDLVNSPDVAIDGCLADPDVNVALLDIHKLLGVGDKINVGKFLILEHNVISSSSYPQISFCLY